MKHHLTPLRVAIIQPFSQIGHKSGIFMYLCTYLCLSFIKVINSREAESSMMF